ncbi:1173_t:CDS:1 [Paraglomus occultum]|uniref:1173_t:CDS:1 n=1 Tax=Paraglomus occultum TaxID=144539 RepID=A0A9N9AN84_9GLOM|nr:1173_t:CDS:1 [Paraglomus occultum]
MLKDPDGLLYHFAVAGHAGTGKSSLINALRGCRDKDKGAAKVGVAETTMAIKQYPDTNSVLNKFVWYDIPGAGTQANRVEQYVIDKGLFVFDFIIICWKDRIMETDMQILNSCKIWKIPTFLVRTNSQTHINNLKLSEDITEKEATDMLKNETHETVKRNLREGNYNELNKKVYIIDKHILGKIVSSFTKKLYSVEDFTKSHLIRNYNITEDDIWTVVNAEGIIVIDEVDFLKDLLETVNMKEQQCLIVRN